MNPIKILYDITQGLKEVDVDTKLLVVKFLARATTSPNPSEYVRERLQRIFDEDDRPPPTPAPRQVNYPYREVKKS